MSHRGGIYDSWGHGQYMDDFLKYLLVLNVGNFWEWSIITVIIIPATPSNPSIPYVKRTSKNSSKSINTTQEIQLGCWDAPGSCWYQGAGPQGSFRNHRWEGPEVGMDEVVVPRWWLRLKAWIILHWSFQSVLLLEILNPACNSG